MSTNPTTLTTEPGQPYIDIVREFDAPVADVFRAHSEPDLVARWLGPRDMAMEIDHYDVRTGGSWAYVHRDPAGTPYGFHGTFHAVDPGRSITQTFEFEGAPGHVSLERITFEDLGDGRTRTHVHAAYQAVEDRDAIVASGMERGLTEGYERMDDLLASL